MREGEESEDIFKSCQQKKDHQLNWNQLYWCRIQIRMSISMFSEPNEEKKETRV